MASDAEDRKANKSVDAKSAMMLKYMDASVLGITVPPELIARMAKAREAAGDDKQKMKELQEAEGIKIAIELVKQVLDIPASKFTCSPCAASRPSS